MLRTWDLRLLMVSETIGLMERLVWRLGSLRSCDTEFKPVISTAWSSDFGVIARRK